MLVYLSLKIVAVSTAVLVGLYAGFLGLLTTSFFQANAVYLHKFQMTWFKNLDIPENFGFPRGQVTPFFIKSSSGGSMYAWHILPIELYRQHELSLTSEPSGVALDFTSRFAFKLLRDDPDARLVIHLHGAGGTVGSGYRVPNYRALSAGDPRTIHVLSFDYRGFGRSKGTPSENGLCLDAISVVDWAMKVVGISPSRILIFGQSLGTAVSLSISEHFALQSPPIVFAGAILVAPFVDVPTLVATYRIAGSIPILSPLAKFPYLFNYLGTFIQDKWSSKDRVASYIRANEANGKRYQIILIHAEDDYDIPFHHTELVFWHAVDAMVPQGITYDQLEDVKRKSRKNLGAAGAVMQWKTNHGILREEILKSGLHDAVMGYPIISMAVMRIFDAADLAFE